MLRAVEAGSQAALLVPTDILADQHNRTLARECQALTTVRDGVERPVRVAMLSSALGRGKERRALLEDLKKGEGA
jgi:ATP-dependent DNA helicase RecG